MGDTAGLSSTSQDQSMTVNILQQPCFFQFLAAIAQTWQISVVTNAGGERLLNLCAFSGDVSILGLSWFC